ncbi:MAG TPA: hypothetical protein VK186_20910 [Candidatus Deferrimicrobium sp.]|nr:hypothetical protein [Candidatus Deferrimicrobium sp.]
MQKRKKGKKKGKKRLLINLINANRLIGKGKFPAEKLELWEYPGNGKSLGPA